jgi:hypothetical protein
MAGYEKAACLAVITAGDPEIRTLLDQGFAFVTNAFQADAAPFGGRSHRIRHPLLHWRGVAQERTAICFAGS